MHLAMLTLVLCAAAMVVLFSRLTPYSQPFKLSDLFVILGLLLIFFWPRRIKR
jgi:hypothetical protein